MTGLKAPPSPSYRRWLLLLLGVATLLQGFDSATAAVALGDLAERFGVSPDDASALLLPTAAVMAGSLLAWPASALADRWGRKKVLVAATLLMGLFTGLMITASNPQAFALLQLCSRVFLIVELVVAITLVVEEFPAERRGSAVGVVAGLAALGVPLAAGVHSMLPEGSSEVLFLVGAAPLVIGLVLAAGIRESSQWEPSGAGGYRIELLQIGAVYFLAQAALWGAGASWTFYASEEAGFLPGQVNGMRAAALIAGFFGYLAAGYVSDRLGRRRTALFFLALGAVAGTAAFRLEAATAVFPAVAIAGFFGFGVGAVLDAMAAESVTQRTRAGALGLVRGVFATLGAVAGVGVVALLTAGDPPLLDEVGDAAALVVLLALAAAVLVPLLPETAGRPLAELAAATRIPQAPSRPYDVRMTQAVPPEASAPPQPRASRTTPPPPQPRASRTTPPPPERQPWESSAPESRNPPSDEG